MECSQSTYPSALKFLYYVRAKAYFSRSAAQSAALLEKWAFALMDI